MLTSTCIKVTTTNFHPITAGNNRCVCQMCTSIPGVPQQQRHKPAYQVGLPSLILMPWGSRSHVRNLLKIHHTGTYSNPQHQAPNICSPLHWQPYQFQRKCLLAILEGKEKLCEADGQAVPTSFWLPYEDVPDFSLKTEEIGGFLCRYFSQIMKIDCFRSKQTGSCFVPAYMGMRSREQSLGLPFLSWEPVNVNIS